MNDIEKDFGTLPLEVQLSAYLDNELPEHLLRQLSLLVHEDDKLNETLARLKLGSEFGDRLFAALLKEPVPLAFARAIRFRKVG